MELGFDISQCILTSYTLPTIAPTNTYEKKLSECDEKAMNATLCGLIEFEFVKFMHYDTAKEIWDKLQNVYEGDDKAKKSKLQTHRG